ncbi:MAG: hypothetical protein R2824_16470 [Saprospiraceae bacterium]
MKKNFLFSVCMLLLMPLAYTQDQIVEFTATPNGTVKLDGDLSAGHQLTDLSWAWNSSNACFPKTQEHLFTGNHVFYKTEIPRRSEMTIRVIPADKNANFSVYAYSGGSGALPPQLPSCVSCEANNEIPGMRQDHTRKVQLRAVNNPYPVTIGVVGAEGLTAGAFTLEVTLEGGEEEVDRPQAQIPLYKAPSEKGKALGYRGDLAEGELMNDLSWAWSSNNACFPKTQEEQYKGHHQLYLTEIPAHSEMTITLVPDDPQENLNLYAYSFGGDLRLVPNLSSCVSCEAGYQPRQGLKKHLRQVELRAVNRPYQVVIGVAGGKGVTSGAYQLQIQVKDY